jgi:hypothetical protein
MRCFGDGSNQSNKLSMHTKIDLYSRTIKYIVHLYPKDSVACFPPVHADDAERPYEESDLMLYRCYSTSAQYF